MNKCDDDDDEKEEEENVMKLNSHDINLQRATPVCNTHTIYIVFLFSFFFCCRKNEKHHIQNIQNAAQ